jgi:hypothetical protein
MATEKPLTPAYASPKSLTTFFNDRRKGPDTDVVDKSLMTNFSGSTQLELMATLKFLGMIGDKGEPQQVYKEYVKATDEGRKAMLGPILRKAYPFIFNVPGFDIERATSLTVAERFRQQNISGSTLSRAVAFFLAVCKEADIKVADNIKPPPMGKSSTPKAKREPAVQAATLGGNGEQRHEAEKAPHGHQIFEIPIPIDRKVKIIIPNDWAPADWDRFTKMLALYVEGWKELAPTKAAVKDKGPTPEE